MSAILLLHLGLCGEMRLLVCGDAQLTGVARPPHRGDGGCGTTVMVTWVPQPHNRRERMNIELNRDWTVSELQAALQDGDPNAMVVFSKARKADRKGECWCGCGGETGGRFVPGHDSRFHSLAKQVARGQTEMPEEFVCDEAEADFLKWHDREVPVWEAKQAAKAAAVAAKAKAKAAKVAAKAEVEESDDEEATEELDADLLAEVTMAG